MTTRQWLVLTFLAGFLAGFFYAACNRVQIPPPRWEPRDAWLPLDQVTT